MNHEESSIQQAIIEWSQLCKHKGLLKFLHHSPNGGKRGIKEGARFKKEGVKAGFPDLVLPVARKGYHGLFIEVKTSKGTMKESQKEWKEFLESEGNYHSVCKSLDEAIFVINWYLGEWEK